MNDRRLGSTGLGAHGLEGLLPLRESGKVSTAFVLSIGA